MDACAQIVAGVIGLRLGSASALVRGNPAGEAGRQSKRAREYSEEKVRR